MTSRKGKGATDVPTESNENQETSVAAETPEAPAEASADATSTSGTEANGAEVAAPAEAPKPDFTDQLNAFKQVLGEVAGVAQEDGSFTDGTRGENGQVSDEDTARIEAAYNALRSDRKAANAAKQAVMEGLTAAVTAAHNDAARAYLKIRTDLENVTAPRAPAKPVDPTEEFIDRYVAVDLARMALFNGVPEGVAENWQERADAKMEALAAGDLTSLLVWRSEDPATRGEEPKVNEVVQAALKIADGRLARGRATSTGGSKRTASTSVFTGERGDIQDHITNAFATGGGLLGGEDGSPVPVGGRLTVSQIQKLPSKTYEGRDPSAGALTSRLFKGKWDEAATGIRPDQSQSPAGAIRVK